MKFFNKISAVVLSTLLFFVSIPAMQAQGDEASFGLSINQLEIKEVIELDVTLHNDYDEIKNLTVMSNDNYELVDQEVRTTDFGSYEVKEGMLILSIKENQTRSNYTLGLKINPVSNDKKLTLTWDKNQSFVHEFVEETKTQDVGSTNELPTEVIDDVGKTEADGVETEKDLTIATSAISRFEIYSKQETELTGTELLAYFGFGISDNSGALSGAIIEIKIPKKFVSTKPEVSPSESVVGGLPTIEESDEHWVLTFEFGILASGVSIDIPFKFKTDEGVTPGNETIVVEGVIKDFEENVVVSSKTNFTTKLKPLSIIKSMITSSGSRTKVNNQNALGGKEDPLNPGYLSTNLDDLKPVRFDFEIQNQNPVAEGNRFISEYIVKDKLPEGAVFVASENPGWTYDEDTRVASKTIAVTNPNGELVGKGVVTKYAETHLNLYFPGARIGSYQTNTMDVTGIPHNQGIDELEYVWNDPITFILRDEKVPPVVPQYTLTFTKRGGSVYSDVLSLKETIEIPWNVYIQLSTDKAGHMENLVIRDHSLDENLYFTRGFIPGTPVSQFVGTVDLYVILENGDRLDILTNQSITSRVDFDLPSNTKEVFLESTKGSLLLLSDSNAYLNMTLYSKIKDPTKTVEKIEYRYNSADASGNYVGVGKVQVNNIKAYATHRPYSAGIYMTKTTPNNGKYFVDDLIDYTLSTYLNSIDKGQTIDFTQIVDLIPNGMEYVENSSSRTTANTTVPVEFAKDSLEPDIVHNYQGTGQTALIWKLNPATAKSYMFSTNSYIPILVLNYKLKVTKYAHEGLNINTAYLAWANNDVMKPYGNITEDIYDLNGNGSTSDHISASSQTVTYVPSRELFVNKEVMGSLDSAYMMDPSTALSELGTESSYRLNLFNNSRVNITNLMIIDVLPHRGDTTTSIDLNYDAQGLRESEFTVGLQGALTVPEGYVVHYATQVPTYSGNDYVDSVNWYESLEDYTQARAFKITLKEGYALDEGERISIPVTIEIPMDPSLENGQKIVNSIGVSTSTNFSSFESNFASLEIVKYRVHGTLFNDFNENGLDDDNIMFGNHLVQLIDAKGNVVLDVDGEPIQTMSDANGFYELDVYRNGDYRIKVITPDGYELIQSKPNDLRGSHIEENTDETTDLFTLDKNNLEERRNAGYLNELTSLKINKVLLNAEGEALSNDVDFEFELMLDGSLYNGPATIDGEAVEVVDGVILLKGGSTVLVNGIKKNVQYSVKEIIGDEYDVTPSDKQYSGTMDNQNKENTFTNQFKIQTTEFTVNKVWVNGPKMKPNISLQLYRDGVEFGDAVILEDGITEYTWTQLDKTDKNGLAYNYSVDEIDVPEDYIKDVQDNEITNTYVSPKTNITVNKVWVGGSETKPSIDVQLYRNGVAFGDLVTLSSGLTEYTWEGLDFNDLDGVPYEYTVDELTVLESYNKSIDGMTITNTFVEPDVIPKDPTKPLIPVDPVKPLDPVVKENDKPTVLPSTGVSQNNLPLIMILSGALMIYIKSRKKKFKSE